MNLDGHHQITSYGALIEEKQRLEKQIENQKNIVRHDVDELKKQFRQQIRPAVEAAQFIRRISKAETRGNIVLTLAVNLMIDITLKRILRNSNVTAQVILPRIFKLGLKTLFSGNGQALLKK